MNSRRIYLDHAATTPLRFEVVEAMRDAAADCDYNPSSLHAEGRRARAALEGARGRIADALGAERREITLTGGGTESNNEALFGAALAAGAGASFVATAVEHRAVLAPLERLAGEGFGVRLLAVASDGSLDPASFAAALEAPATLASVMYANNEIGTVQPVAELAAIARSRGVLFHTDAVQAPSWLSLDVRELGVDMLSLSAHKFGGPRGVGLLYVRRGSPVAPFVLGGGQEFGRRSGTENVAGAVGMARALELAVAERAEASRRVAELRDRLERAILATVPDARVNGAGPRRLANNLNVSFAGSEPAAALIALDLAGIAVSAGSACTSGTPQRSHVLEAIGADAGAIRFSLGPKTTQAEIDRVAALLPPILAGLRGSPVSARGESQGDG